MEQSRFEKQTVTQLVKKFSALYETRRFVTVSTGARQLSPVNTVTSCLRSSLTWY